MGVPINSNVISVIKSEITLQFSKKFIIVCLF